jgi:hypothetical protein
MEFNEIEVGSEWRELTRNSEAGEWEEPLIP